MHRRSLSFNLPIRQKCRITTGVSRGNHLLAARNPRSAPGKASDVQVITKLTEQLVDGARKLGPEWKRTRSMRGEEMRLLELVNSAKTVKPESDRVEDFLDAETDSEVASTFDGSEEAIAPGTFVELRRHDSLVNGIVLFEHLIDRKYLVAALASSGMIQVFLRTDITFIMPGFVSGDLTRRCGTSPVPQSQKEAMARVEVLKRLKGWERDLEIAFSAVGQSAASIYPRVKSPDANQWSEITVAEAVKLIIPHPQPPLVTTFAVHKHLMRRNAEFFPDHLDYRHKQRFHVRPQSHVDTINAVTAMSRMTNGPLDAFSEKVQRIRASARKRRAESKAELPSYQQVDQSIFTSDDKLIIDFLLHSLYRESSMQASAYNLGLSSILKRFDDFEAIDKAAIHSLLTDMGVVAPWQDPISLLRDNINQHQDTLESPPITLPTRSSSRILTNLGPQDFYSYDLAESIRHDFGDMPVYVIDDYAAKELDDGMSYEAIPSEPGSGWVHVHIADPTAVIPPTHMLVPQARKQGESLYFLHRTSPMLPPPLVTEKLSLNSSMDANGKRVLTFSFKVDSKGDITDYQVRAALIKNLHILRYDDVDLTMGFKPPLKHFPFGVSDIVRPLPVHIDSVHLHNLRALNEVADRLVTARLRLPTFTQSPPIVSISLSQQPPVPPPFDFRKPTEYRGFPKLTYALSSNSALDVGSRRLVSEMMKAACRVASLFCLERGVPVLRRASNRITTKTEEDFEKLLSTRDANGYVNHMDVIRLEAHTPPATSTLEPKMHWGLGVPEGEGYVRVTSPLRRYSDLVSHWQIKHALLDPRGKAPFSEEFLVQDGVENTTRATQRRQAMKSHEKFWAVQFIQRWMEDKRRTVDGVDPLEGLIGTTVSLPAWDKKEKVHSCFLRLETLGINATFELDRGAEMPIGTEVPVKLTGVRLGFVPKLFVARR